MRKVSIGRYLFYVQPLTEALDTAFDRLYERVMIADAEPQLDVAFMSAAAHYFDSYIDSMHSPAAHDHYFYGFNPLWVHFRAAGKVHLADEIFQIALRPAQEWERMHPGHLIDKGVPFYYRAMTALLLGNIDRGYVLAHQAAEEDSRTSSGLRYPDTPAYALVSLDYEKANQAFKGWVDEQAVFLNTFVTDYATVHGRTFRVNDVRDRFLRNPPNHDIGFLLTYAVARLKEFSEIPVEAKRNPFVGQLQLKLLFDLLLVIDNAIKQKNGSGEKFVSHAIFLLDKTGHAFWNLSEVNGLFNANFGARISDALDGNLIVNRIALDRMQCDVAVAYGLRNRGAHNIGSQPVIWNDFDRIQSAVFRTFCATVDYLY